MKLKEWLDNLNAMVAKDPSILELDAITASDDEGNSYNDVNYTPSVGNFDGLDFGDEVVVNSICLN